MSNFSFGALETKKSKIGVWLRPYSTNTELMKKIKKIGRVKSYEMVERIVLPQALQPSRLVNS